MMKAMLYAFLAAVFYAVNIPASKVLLRDVGPATMAALLVLAATVCWGFKDRPASDCPCRVVGAAILT